MKMSTKGRYGVMAMIDIAVHSRGEAVYEATQMGLLRG